MYFYLASASPRRRELLDQIHLPFTVVSSSYSEVLTNGAFSDPRDLVEWHALGKARGAFPLPAAGLCIGADTIVLSGEEVLGKPACREEAVQMLRMLSGSSHEVITGLALVDEHGKAQVAHEVTKVKFRRLSLAEIEAYVDSGEPTDKAGAYAIQGRAALFVSGIMGCYANVVGLPLGLLAELAEQHWGVRLTEAWR